MTNIEPLCGQPDPLHEYQPCDFPSRHTGPCSHVLDRLAYEALDRPFALSDDAFYRPTTRPNFRTQQKPPRRRNQ